MALEQTTSRCLFADNCRIKCLSSAFSCHNKFCLESNIVKATSSSFIVFYVVNSSLVAPQTFQLSPVSHPKQMSSDILLVVMQRTGRSSLLSPVPTWTRLGLMNGWMEEGNVHISEASNNDQTLFYDDAHNSAAFESCDEKRFQFSLPHSWKTTCRIAGELVFRIYYVYLISMKKGCS